MIETPRNWAGNITYGAARLHYPETVAQVQHLVTHYRKLKVIGARHSFTDIADSPEVRSVPAQQFTWQHK